MLVASTLVTFIVALCFGTAFLLSLYLFLALSVALALGFSTRGVLVLVFGTIELLFLHIVMNFWERSRSNWTLAMNFHSEFIMLLSLK